MSTKSILEINHKNNILAEEMKKNSIVTELILQLMVKEIDPEFCERNGNDIVFKFFYIDENNKLVVRFCENIGYDDYEDGDDIEYNDKEFDIPIDLLNKYTYLYDCFDSLLEAKRLEKLKSDVERNIRNNKNRNDRYLYQSLNKYRNRFNFSLKQTNISELKNANQDIFKLLHNQSALALLDSVQNLEVLSNQINDAVLKLNKEIEDIQINATKHSVKAADRMMGYINRQNNEKLAELSEKLNLILTVLKITEDDLKVVSSSILYLKQKV